MKYNIYCKFTHKLLAVYTNKATLEKLDLNRCYYVEVHPAKKEKNKELPKSESNRHSNDNHASNNDSMNILNPISPIYQSANSNQHSHTGCNSYYGSSQYSSDSCGSSDSSSSCSSSCD